MEECTALTAPSHRRTCEQRVEEIASMAVERGCDDPAAVVRGNLTLDDGGYLPETYSMC